jgi:DNA-directed RNA polymerase subunit RPC12/RpoP
VNEPIVCITNQLDDFRPCVERDTHFTHALGVDEPDPVRAARIREWHLAECAGCLPRHAEVGFLCRPCAHRVDTALRAYDPFRKALAGVDRAVQTESVTRGRPGSQLPIPPVPLSFEEIDSYRRTFGGSLDVWAATEAGAADAVRYARAMRTAERAHPTEERSHAIRITRCPRCNHRTLVWHPPTRFLGEVVVRCEYSDGATDCGYTVDQAAYEEVAAIEERPRPITPKSDRALVFAARRLDAVDWAREHDLRPSDWIYIGSPVALRGMTTGHRDRHFLDGFDSRRDATAIREQLTLADVMSLAVAS